MLAEKQKIKEELKQQIEYNQQIQLIEKKNDIELGQQMAFAAQQSI